MLENTYKLKDSADTLVPVNAEVLLKAECLLKFCGSEDKESLEDFLENIELPKRLTEQSITSFILLQRVTNSKTEPYSLKLFSNKKARRSKTISSKLNKKLEDKRIKREEKREQKNRKDFDPLCYI